MEQVTAGLLASIFSTALSLLLTYVPGLNTWWDGLGEELERFWTAVSYAAIAGVLYLGSLQGWFPYDPNIWTVLSALVGALLGGQSAYTLTNKNA